MEPPASGHAQLQQQVQMQQVAVIVRRVPTVKAVMQMISQRHRTITATAAAAARVPQTSSCLMQRLA
jgi:hypothetical protein